MNGGDTITNEAIYRSIESIYVLGLLARSCMLDTVLHTGSEHPDLLWILIPSFLSFVAGLGVMYAARVRNWLQPSAEPTND